jgi:hypothetical protein
MGKRKKGTPIADLIEMVGRLMQQDGALWAARSSDTWQSFLIDVLGFRGGRLEGAMQGFQAWSTMAEVGQFRQEVRESGRGKRYAWRHIPTGLYAPWEKAQLALRAQRFGISLRPQRMPWGTQWVWVDRQGRFTKLPGAVFKGR